MIRDGLRLIDLVVAFRRVLGLCWEVRARDLKGLRFSGWSCPGRTWAAEVLRLHSPNAVPYCAAGVDRRVGCGSTDLGELVRGLKL